jgi:hypothetical protein
MLCFYIEGNVKIHQKLLELINELSKVSGFKISTHK